MDFAQFLDEWRQIELYPGAQLKSVAHSPGSLAMEFLAAFWPPERDRKMAITAVRVKDWLFKPDHALLEGTNPLELITDDHKLSREYLESLDCEGDREIYPERVVMLRHGLCYVIAEHFEAEWIMEPTGDSSTGKPPTSAPGAR